MNKILYALIMVIIALFGVGGLLYGLYMMWKPLAFVIGGIIFVAIALMMNELYDASEKGGDK